MERRWRKIWVSFFEDQRFVRPHSSIALMNLVSADDRFIAKELSRPELQTMETFAPAYFDYMSSAVSANVSYTSHRLITKYSDDLCSDQRY